MNYRRLGKTGFDVSEIALGTWQVGGKWGTGFDADNATAILNKAIDEGINFIDTADVYENGRSEAMVGRVVNHRSEEVFIATKCGRQIRPHVNEGYTPDVLRKYVEQSLRNLRRDHIDLIQLHCPPTEVYYRPEIFRLFEDLASEGKIRSLGVSVQKVEEALKAMNFPNVASVQIIFNMFRQRPAEQFFKQAVEKDVGIIVRVPLASGLLSGNYTRDTMFGEGDHRNFNREGKAFDKGETFSGIPYETGLHAVGELKTLFPGYKNLAPIALKWVLMYKEVSCVIPGASKVEQLISNLTPSHLPDIDEEKLKAVNDIYKKYIKELVHERW